jgi:predicted MFS family arabinose efflux permease
MPYQTYLSAFLQNEAGYSAATAAHAWRVIGLVGMFSGFAVGALADRITVRLGMFFTYGILAASCLLLLAARGGDNLAALYGATVAFGVSFYAVFGLVPAYIGHFFGSGSAALVFAFGNIALGLGGIIGNALGGWMKQSSGSFAPIYFVMLAAAVASAALTAVMPCEKRAILKAPWGHA